MRNSLVGLSLLTGALLASSAAMADPVYSVDGINIPIAGVYVDTALSFENLVTATGQSFGGVFKVSSIAGADTNFTYQYGDNSKFLTGIFNNFVVSSITGNIGLGCPSGCTIKLTGGQLQYYVETTNTFTNNAGTATDFVNASSGQLFLNAKPETIDLAGDTLILTIPAANSLSNFSNASANAFLDVNTANPGLTGSLFDTNTFTNTFSGDKADFLFNGSANSANAGPDFTVKGSNDLSASAIPEPITISLFGAGLAGAFGFGRKKSKKA